MIYSKIMHEFVLERVKLIFEIKKKAGLTNVKLNITKKYCAKIWQSHRMRIGGKVTLPTFSQLNLAFEAKNVVKLNLIWSSLFTKRQHRKTFTLKSPLYFMYITAILGIKIRRKELSWGYTRDLRFRMGSEKIYNYKLWK